METRKLEAIVSIKEGSYTLLPDGFGNGGYFSVVFPLKEPQESIDITCFKEGSTEDYEIPQGATSVSYHSKTYPIARNQGAPTRCKGNHRLFIRFLREGELLLEYQFTGAHTDGNVSYEFSRVREAYE